MPNNILDGNTSNNDNRNMMRIPDNLFNTANDNHQTKERSYNRVNTGEMESHELLAITSFSNESSLFEQNASFSKSIGKTLTLLKIFGFFPTLFPKSGRSKLRSLYCVLLYLYTIFILGILLYFSQMLIRKSYLKSLKDSLLDGTIMANTIITLLPIQNFINLVIFSVLVKNNIAAIKQFDELTKIFPISHKISLRVFGPTMLIVIIPLVIRVAHMICIPEQIYGWKMALVTFLIPCFRVWQLLPLIYFALFCYMLQKWFETLAKQISKSTRPDSRLLSYYFDVFDQLTRASKVFGEFLSPFVFTSIMFSVLCLGISIYCITQAGSVITFPAFSPNTTDNFIWRYKTWKYFDLAYAMLQIVIAAVYLIVVCIMGRKVNEQARHCIGVVQRLDPQDNYGRFQVIRFTNKLNNQLSWGISVWRSFLIERSLLFTLTSTIIAYSLFLVRMGGSKQVQPKS